MPTAMAAATMRACQVEASPLAVEGIPIASYGLEGRHRVVRVQRQFLKARREKTSAVIGPLQQAEVQAGTCRSQLYSTSHPGTDLG